MGKFGYLYVGLVIAASNGHETYGMEKNKENKEKNNRNDKVTSSFIKKPAPVSKSNSFSFGEFFNAKIKKKSSVSEEIFFVNTLSENGEESYGSFVENKMSNISGDCEKLEPYTQDDYFHQALVGAVVQNQVDLVKKLLDTKEVKQFCFSDCYTLVKSIAAFDVVPCKSDVDGIKATNSGVSLHDVIDNLSYDHKKLLLLSSNQELDMSTILNDRLEGADEKSIDLDLILYSIKALNVSMVEFLLANNSSKCTEKNIKNYVRMVGELEKKADEILNDKKMLLSLSLSARNEQLLYCSAAYEVYKIVIADSEKRNYKLKKDQFSFKNLTENLRKSLNPKSTDKNKSNDNKVIEKKE